MVDVERLLQRGVQKQRILRGEEKEGPARVPRLKLVLYQPTGRMYNWLEATHRCQERGTTLIPIPSGHARRKMTRRATTCLGWVTGAGNRS